ncbi:MAG: hypothetical protein QM709_03165 [Spongiibacteraceae bacterium]
MSITRAVRLSGELIDAAETIGNAEGRFAAGQIEFWANIGRQLAPHLSPTDLVAIQLGQVHIHVEAMPSPRVNPQDFFTEVKFQ